MDAPIESDGPRSWSMLELPAACVNPRMRARDRRLLWLLLAAWIINLFDLSLTLLAWRQNFMVELNPVAAKVLPHGTAAIVIYKVTLLLIGTTALWYCRRYWATEPIVWAYVIICICLSFWWHKLVKDVNYCWVDMDAAAYVHTVPHTPPVILDNP